MARQETIQIIIDHQDADKALSTLKQAAATLQQTLASIKVGNTTTQFNNQAQSAQQSAQAIQQNTNAILQNTSATRANVLFTNQNIQAARNNAQAVQQNTQAALQSVAATRSNSLIARQNTQAVQGGTQALGRNTNAMRQSVQATQQSIQATNQSTQATQQNAQAVQVGTQALGQNTQTVRQSIQAVQQNIQATNQSAQATQQNTQAVQHGVTAIQQTVQAFQQAIAAQRQHAQQQQQNAQQARNQATIFNRLGQQVQNLNALYPANLQYMRQQIQSMAGLNNANVTATGNIRVLGNEFQTYRASVQEASGVTHNYRIAVNTANGEVYRLDQGIRSASLSLTDMSVILRAIRTIVGFTGIAQSFRSAFSEMKNMSDAMAEYRKVTGATTQEMEALRDTAYEVAKAYGESASGVISSAANMARAGYKENSLAMAELATKTKLVGDMTQETADKFLIAVDAAYKYQGNVEQLSSVLDAANALDNQYATTIEKISDGMTLVASLASTAHVPVEQLMAALGTMTAVTQRSGAETARGLRSIILNVMGDTSTEIEEGVTATEDSVKSMTDALIKYGDESVKAAAKAGKIINPMEAIVSLQKAWKENQITEQDLYQISNEVAGKRYYNVFTALIQNPEMYNDMLQSIAESMGSAQNEIDILMDSWTRKTEVLRTTWTQLVNQSISEGLIKDLIDGATAALEFAGSLENLALAAGGALVAFRALSAGIGNLSHGGTFGGFNIGMGLLGIGIAGLSAWKAYYEKNIREMQQAASEAVASAIEKTSGAKSLEDLVKRYSEIASDGIQTEQGELEELKTLQSELNGLVGGQATAIDIVNGKYADTLTALQKLTEKQRESVRLDLVAARSKAVAAFNQSDLNGTWNWGEDTGVLLPVLKSKEAEWLRHYIQLNTEFFSIGSASVFQGGTAGAQRLNITKPTDAESIVRLIEEADALYKLFGSKTVSGEEAIGGLQSIGEEYSGMYEALGKFVTALHEAGDSVVDAQNAINDFDNALTEVGGGNGSKGSAGTASGAMDDAAESAYTLADAIDAATKAKEKFDDAMKNSKADAMDGYITAFKTLQEEIDAGRVNSTAFYASARMLLGDESYNATGGSVEGVMAALRKRGASGSVSDAYKILSEAYYDSEGKEIAGYGLLQLLSQTKGYTGIKTNPDGTVSIPELSDADLAQISASWGGISKELILSFFDALDQYDKQGIATDENVKAQRTKTEEKPTETVTEQPTQQEQAQEEATEAQKEAGETLTEAAEALTEAAEAQKEQASVEAPGGQETNMPGGSGGWEIDLSEVRFGKSADALKEAADEQKDAAEAQKEAAEQVSGQEKNQPGGNSWLSDLSPYEFEDSGDH